VQRPQEELGELTAEQRAVGECVAEHSPGTNDPRPARHPTEPRAETRQEPGGDERPEAPARIRRFGVDQAHRAQSAVADHRVPGDQAAAVVADDGDPVEFEEVDHPTDGLDVLGDRHRGVGVEPAGPGGREVDQVARDVVDEVGQEPSERRRAHRPPVDEQHVGAAADPAVGGLARPDVEEPFGLAPEEVGGLGLGQCLHGAPEIS
jgi:hypothetical protein